MKYFGDGLLDLITPDEEVRSQLVDYWGQPELLYLGPDEHIIPSDINWLVERAAVRGKFSLTNTYVQLSICKV